MIDEPAQLHDLLNNIFEALLKDPIRQPILILARIRGPCRCFRLPTRGWSCRFHMLSLYLGTTKAIITFLLLIIALVF